MYVKFPNIKFVSTLKTLREIMYVTQASLVYKTLISTVVMSRHDVSHSN